MTGTLATAALLRMAVILASADAATLSPDPTPPQTEEVGDRLPPVVELGHDFLGQGEIRPGIKLPTGAVWQPSLLVFGTMRSGLQTYEVGGRTEAEWANRLDLFANLTLTGTERVLIGFRPLNDGAAFSGYDWGAEADDRWRGEWSATVQTLFFEGDVGELFPRFDAGDRRALDLGFAVGRQPLFFQEGLLIDDSIDSVGLTRNTLRPADTSNLRFTGIFGWGGLDRAGGEHDASAQMFGLFTELDRERSTVDVDFVLVRGQENGDSLHVGAGAVQRWGTVNTAFRALASVPFDDDVSGADSGGLLLGEVSWSPHGSHDITYVNAFAAFDHYTPAARDPLAGGTLARVGILFEGPGLGRHGAALDATAEDSVGGVLGYQRFLRGGRSQLVGEIGVRHAGDASDTSLAVGGRFQHAIGRRTLAQLDGSIAWPENSEARYGGRLELLVKF